MNINKLMWFWNSSAASSAFDDIWGWWRADDYSGSSPNIVLNDKSGNGNAMTQAAGTLTPGTAANGQARMVGNSTARLTSAGTIESWPVTIITVALRANNTTMGFFGHTGAIPTNSLWNGYESTNRNFVYNTNGTSNTTAEAGATSCYIARLGYGSRLTFVNGVLQSDQALASIVRSAAITTSIGTEYRGLNGEWQETLVWNRPLTIAEIDEVHTYINTRYSLSIPLWSSYTATPTIWLGGQSNASGRGARGTSDANIPAEYDTALTNCNVWYGTIVGNIGSAFATLDVNANNHMLGDDAQAATRFGCELTLCKEYIDRVGGSVYLSKLAQGSTYLNYHNTTSGFWHPTNNSLSHSNAFRFYGIAMRNWWKAMAVHQTAGRRPDIKALIWFQGEQDATVQAYAEAYASNGVTFFNELQPELGFSTSLKKLICRIHVNGGETYESTVRAQQATLVSSLTNATLIDTDGFSAPDVHLDYTGQLDLGTYLAGLL